MRNQSGLDFRLSTARRRRFFAGPSPFVTPELKWLGAGGGVGMSSTAIISGGSGKGAHGGLSSHPPGGARSRSRLRDIGAVASAASAKGRADRARASCAHEFTGVSSRARSQYAPNAASGSNDAGLEGTGGVGESKHGSSDESVTGAGSGSMRRLPFSG